jgi:DHA1 family tetracycline resistance protein-like MFS transporter
MSARSPALWFAVFVVFIDALGMSIIIPIMPKLLGELTGQTVAESALWGGVLTAVYAVNQFLFGPIIGALSDRFGRRPLILLSLAALVIDYLLMAVAWTVWLLFLGRFLAGLAGAAYTVATAYIADVSPKDKRSQNFGLVGAAFGVGFIIGPVLGGLAAMIDVRAPLYLAAAICFIGVLFGFFVLPESLKDENRSNPPTRSPRSCVPSG